MPITLQHPSFCTCELCRFALEEAERAALVESGREQLREELEVVFKDYARHEAEQGNYLLSGVWYRAAEIVSGYVSRSRVAK